MLPNVWLSGGVLGVGCKAGLGKQSTPTSCPLYSRQAVSRPRGWRAPACRFFSSYPDILSG